MENSIIMKKIDLFLLIILFLLSCENKQVKKDTTKSFEVSNDIKSTLNVACTFYNSFFYNKTLFISSVKNEINLDMLIKEATFYDSLQSVKSSFLQQCFDEYNSRDTLFNYKDIIYMRSQYNQNLNFKLEDILIDDKIKLKIVNRMTDDLFKNDSITIIKFYPPIFDVKNKFCNIFCTAYFKHNGEYIKWNHRIILFKSNTNKWEVCFLNDATIF